MGAENGIQNVTQYLANLAEGASLEGSPGANPGDAQAAVPAHITKIIIL